MSTLFEYSNSTGLEVRKAEPLEARLFVEKHHYAKGVNRGSIKYGLYLNGKLVGICAFGIPTSEATRATVFGHDLRDTVMELHRLAILDEMPTNTGSWFIVRALRQLKKDRPKTNAVLSYSDPTEGHLGVVYQACNALYCGKTDAAVSYRDTTGRLRPRRNKIYGNISQEMAKQMGWTLSRRLGKHRYLFLVPDNKKHKKELLNLLRLRVLPYPKKENNG